MHLLMFDVDGTLLRSNEYDAQCFIRALSMTLGFTIAGNNWDSYEHVTDSGIFQELVRRSYDRQPSQEEIRLVQARFLSELDRLFDTQPWVAQTIEGAIEFVAAVQEAPDCAVSIATGGWERSCRKKLEQSGFCVAGIPLASADDAIARVDIMNASLSKALKAYEQSAFDTITYLGDGSWDMKASMELGWNFIAVGEPILSYIDSRPRYWIKDFADIRELDRILDDIGTIRRVRTMTDGCP
jgi:phosphoglycolate phosphatase-like HAD superfamily hydrolase